MSVSTKDMDINQLIQQGIALYDKGNHEGALKHFMRLDKSFPDSGNILYEMANTCYALKDYKTALKYAEKAGALLPQAEKVKILLGNINDNMDNPEEAVTQYNKAVQINPESDSVYFNLGVSYYNNRKYDEAEKALNASLKLINRYSSCFYSIVDKINFIKESRLCPNSNIRSLLFQSL